MLRARSTRSTLPRRRPCAGAAFDDLLRTKWPLSHKAQLAAWVLAVAEAANVYAQCQPAWQDVGGVWGTVTPNASTVHSLDSFNPDAPAATSGRLYIGGGFGWAGTVAARRAAARDARSWQSLGAGINAPGATTYGVAGIDASTGGPLQSGVYFLGGFGEAGGVSVNNMARWSGQAWHALAVSACPERRDAKLFNGPSGPAIYAAGWGLVQDGSLIDAVSMWDGSAWHPLGQGLEPTPPQTYVIAMALETHDDDGPGIRAEGLYVAGDFGYAGGALARNIARWDGKSWEPLGIGIAGTVESLGVFDIDGPGPLLARLVAGGQFDFAGGGKADGLGMWDGQQWSDVPGWSHGPVKTMAVFDDDGPGPNEPALFVGGLFNNTPAGLGNQIAKWDGQQWFTLGPVGQTGVTGWGISTEVMALAVFDEDGDGPNPGGLYVGGFFTHAGGIPATAIARWGCPAPAQCYANCTLDFHPVTGAHILTIADFGCFQTKFVLQDPYADCNADGALTVSDFGCFQTKFVTGCP